MPTQSPKPRYLVAHAEPYYGTDLCVTLAAARESALAGQSVKGDTFLVQDVKSLAILWSTAQEH